jgi:hypothetical protein
LAGAALAALLFVFCVLDVRDDDVRDDVVLEGVFPPGALGARAGLGAAGLADRARRPVLLFRTRFIMAPVT